MRIFQPLARAIVRNRRIVDAIIERAKARPYFHIEGYMRRYWLVGGGSDSRERWAAVRVHEILRSDADRHLHDHPAWNISVILAGGYWEARPVDKSSFSWCLDRAGKRTCEQVTLTWRGPGSVVIRRATDRHKLLLAKGQTCWSLFIIGHKSNEWGFYTPDGKVGWRNYGATA